VRPHLHVLLVPIHAIALLPQVQDLLYSLAATQVLLLLPMLVVHNLVLCNALHHEDLM